ncbi:alpha/beta fold hydrolase [Cryobacterium sp. TMT1-21]|uniref:Alpha/beta fold hydrolase n=1 Tax=Cryobacterium shii TaxID=1259235 RepID=A0AAQ2C5K2_9MICO|nr:MULTISPECIES: alpha/beta fold hydrolase [Cryobacterium]TFC46165.1 alpha/beta fold hydrolase [Cryobacterium shii]TFC81624.1 alpha/beta fold hydrolase [Cryobacterium sp. TmT2-59]TFD12503.1 alpha/beta fold hydrolase [Cryobacterium sp. TMT4-10]TFD13307.1 alpha/beta fold hydrolase [Cryobacterium sp. TMT1-21]TFD16717.1 alpha/beta fold hydrolase [Cryobacterium sp. TMT2-23]
MPHLTVPGASLYYETTGHVSSPALLLLHAGIANLRMWDPQVAALAASHFVIRFDSRGFGQTLTEDVEFSPRGDALAVLDHLGVASATLIGCSRGGSTAIDLTLEHPHRVTGLVTIGSGPSGFPEVELTELEDAHFDQLDAAFDDQDWHKLARLEVALWAFGPLRSELELDPEFVATAYALNRVNAVHAEEHPTPMPLEPPAFDRLVDIEVPALVTVGEFDITPALAQFEFLLSTVPDATGCTFRNTAHLPSVEQPAEFNRVLVNWLAEHNL